MPLFISARSHFLCETGEASSVSRRCSVDDGPPKVLKEGISRRQLARQTGLSRNTIRKMLLHELPQPYKRRTSSVFTIVPHQVSISEIYRYLKRQENYSASYGAVRDYLKYRFCARQAPNKILWERLYEEITSSSKKDAINILRVLSFNGSPLISSTRLQRFGRDVASLREHRVLCSRHAQTRQDVDWLNRVLRTYTPPVELEGRYRDPGDSNELIERVPPEFAMGNNCKDPRYQ